MTILCKQVISRVLCALQSRPELSWLKQAVWLKDVAQTYHMVLQKEGASSSGSKKRSSRELKSEVEAGDVLGTLARFGRESSLSARALSKVLKQVEVDGLPEAGQREGRHGSEERGGSRGGIITTGLVVAGVMSVWADG